LNRELGFPVVIRAATLGHAALNNDLPPRAASGTPSNHPFREIVHGFSFADHRVIFFFFFLADACPPNVSFPLNPFGPLCATFLVRFLVPAQLVVSLFFQRPLRPGHVGFFVIDAKANGLDL